ncbi:MAG: ClbS/DfsB family four-helix bundle protein [Chlamydiales bacterium]|nr:ClbS/DfsB family four-helix bundle protein [Chlamydiales bacterium]
MSSCTLSQDILREYNRLVELVAQIPSSVRTLKTFDGTGGKVSVADLIAYQIGWGKCLIRWYEAGIQEEMPKMPGEGFLTWDYTGLAHHFYQTYQFDSAEEQMSIFHQTVLHILEIVEAEHQTGNLDRAEVWPWCTLPSGKKWPLSKWIRVNTASPYKRAARLIKKEGESS